MMLLKSQFNLENNKKQNKLRNLYKLIKLMRHLNYSKLKMLIIIKQILDKIKLRKVVLIKI